MRSQSEVSPKVVLVLGKTGVGKSTFIQSATSLDVKVGHAITSCTEDVQIYPVRDSDIYLIDTPGFDDTTRSNADILQSIASCLADLHEGLIFDGRSVDLAGIAYVHAIDDTRMKGSMMNDLNMFQHLAGQDKMQHCVFLTTKWSLADRQMAEKREASLKGEPKFWRGSIENGASMMRFQDSHESAMAVLSQVTRGGSFVCQLTQEYILDGRKLQDTSAGRAIDQNLTALRDECNANVTAMKREYDQALADRNADVAAHMYDLRVKSSERLAQLDSELSSLSETRHEMQERLDDLEIDDSAALLPKSDDEKRKEKRKRRLMRACRWFIRCVSVGGAVAIGVLSHGVLVPVSVSIVFGVETILQQMKANEQAESHHGKK